LCGAALLGLLSCGLVQPGGREPSLDETKQYILDKMNALGSGFVNVTFEGDALVFAAKDRTAIIPLAEMDVDKLYFVTDIRDRQKCVGFHFKAVSSRKVIKVETSGAEPVYTDEQWILDGFRGTSGDGEKIHKALLHAHKLMDGKKELF
jgi:hypothetical protein